MHIQNKQLNPSTISLVPIDLQFFFTKVITQYIQIENVICRHMGNCSLLRIISRIQKKSNIYFSENDISKKRKKNTRNNVEKLVRKEPSLNISENLNWVSLYRKQYREFSKFYKQDSYITVLFQNLNRAPSQKF